MSTAEFLSTPVHLTPFEIDQLGQRAAKLAEALFALKFVVEAGGIYDVGDVERTRTDIEKMRGELDTIDRILPPRPTLALPAPSQNPIIRVRAGAIRHQDAGFVFYSVFPDGLGLQPAANTLSEYKGSKQNPYKRGKAVMVELIEVPTLKGDR